MADICLGKFKLTKSQGFEEFLKELDVNMVIRKMANSSHPKITVTVGEDGTWTIKTRTLIKKSSIVFKLGEEFDEVRQDNVKVKSTITREGDTLTHVMKADDKVVKIIREFRADGLHTEAEVNGVKTIRFYERIKDKNAN